LVGLGLLGVFVAGCSGGPIGAGDYAVYRIASSETSRSAECGDEDEGDSSSLRQGGTVILYGVSEESGEETLYLDLGGLVLAGAANEDGSYSFAGKVTDVEESGGEQIVDSDHDGLEDGFDDPFVDADADGLDDDFDDESVDTDGDGQDDRFDDELVDANNDGQDDRIVEIGGVKLTITQVYDVSFFDDSDGVSGTSKVSSSMKCEGGDLCVGFPESGTCTQTTTFVGIEIEQASVSVPVGPGQPAPGGDDL
jgi:hypothetical protein